ncbi:MAG TPA: ParA family protein [Cyanobacteria bacterium UBA11369]|nr:ParA family protein [Cyanobacteria bacterium UBA11371]HBE31314.1 ParA family protein [Cyanobacteria bacterium UBA11368]HBE53319.1 ParA family protein [Cyanobacteria bacterium UBA11369]
MQIRLAVISNAGGSGKTTLSVHLAYELGLSRFNVALMDLDPQGSLTLFCGLTPPEPSHTLAAVLRDSFDGNWPLVSCWSAHTDKVVICQGGMVLTQTADELVLHKRGAYLLADRLADYPLEHDLIIFDCPATLGPLPLMALAASSHVVIPVQLEPKSIQGAARLLEWYYFHCKHLRLNPPPEIVGFVPNQYDSRRAAHRQLLESLPKQLESMNIRAFGAIRDSAEFVNASGVGLPLHLYRPIHSACKDFKELAVYLASILGKTEASKSNKGIQQKKSAKEHAQ